MEGEGGGRGEENRRGDKRRRKWRENGQGEEMKGEGEEDKMGVKLRDGVVYRCSNTSQCQ